MKYINYKEERNHGTIDFPIEFYHVTPNHPRYDLSLIHISEPTRHPGISRMPSSA